jgi:hypothetical protein
VKGGIGGKGAICQSIYNPIAIFCTPGAGEGCVAADGGDWRWGTRLGEGGMVGM